MTTNFQTLRVYQLAEKLADRIWKIVMGWDYFAKSTLGQQLVDAADGVGANIAEGSGRGSLLDNRRFVKIARGSLYETKHWLRRAYTRKLLAEKEICELKPIMDELLPSLNAYVRSLNQAVDSNKAKNEGQRSKRKNV